MKIQIGDRIITIMGNRPEELQAKTQALLAQQRYYNNEITKLRLGRTMKMDLAEILDHLNSEAATELIISYTDLRGFKYPEAYTSEANALLAAQVRIQNILEMYELGLEVKVAGSIFYLEQKSVAEAINSLLDLSGRGRYPAADIAETTALSAELQRQQNILKAISLNLLEKPELHKAV